MTYLLTFILSTIASFKAAGWLFDWAHRRQERIKREAEEAERQWQEFYAHGQRLAETFIQLGRALAQSESAECTYRAMSAFEQLEAKLAHAIRTEDYEWATELRDQINALKNNSKID